MFFSQPVEFHVDRYIENQWATLSEFCEYLNSQEELLLQGHGFFAYEQKGQFTQFFGYHLTKINNTIFAFAGKNSQNRLPKEEESLVFENIIEFKANILRTVIFEDNHFRPTSNYFKNFDANLMIEAKIYNYTNEDKLLLSKYGEGNIDLYCSYQVSTHSEHELSCKVYPSAQNAAKHLSMSKLLDQRIASLKK